MQGLLIIDVQNDYFAGGKSELVNLLDALKNVKSILTTFRQKGFPIIHVQHINTRPEASFFIPDTHGVKIHREVQPLDKEKLIIKHMPNSFYETDLADFIISESIEELVVCGMMTHMCIDTTVRAAKDISLPVNLLYDACATKDLAINGRTISAPIVHDSYMAGLSGMFAEIKMTQEYIHEIE